MDGLLTAEELAAEFDENLDDGKLHAEYRRLVAEQAALRRVAMLVARGVEPLEVFGAVAEEMRRCVPADTAGLWRFESDREITIVAAAAEPEALTRWPVGTRTPVEGTTLAALVQRTGRPARIDSYDHVAGPIAARVRAAGSKIVSSATTVDEALWLEAHGVDAIVAQGFEAGGHRGMFLSDDLTTQVGTFALLTVALSWTQWRFPRTRSLITGRAVLVISDGQLDEDTMRRQRLSVADDRIAVEPEIKLWDLAPLDVLVREAGGSFTNLEGAGGPHGGSAVATNGLLYERVLTWLSPV